MAVFEMCRKYVSKRDYTYKSKPVKKEANIVEDAAKVVAGAVGAVVDTTKLIGNKVSHTVTDAIAPLLSQVLYLLSRS